MSWSSQHRALYGLSAVGFVVLIGLSIGAFLSYDPPSCTDNLKNGDELGVDCGGSCLKLCPDEARLPQVRWSRSFPVRSGLYTSVAYLDNPNIHAGAGQFQYTFKLYDVENILIAERQGTTFLPPESLIPVFESGVETGNRVVARTSFEFSAPTWVRRAGSGSPLSVQEPQFSGASTTPKLTARVANASASLLSGIEVVAVLFDTEDNAFAASKTLIPTLAGNASAPVVFTWPEAFSSAPSRIEIIPRLPFEAR